MRLTIPGKPRTQGSMTLWRGADGAERAKYGDETKNHRNLVVGLAMQEWGGRPPLDGEVGVKIVANYVRPKHHFGTGRNAKVLKASAPARPTGRAYGDVDKVARLVLDALDIAGVYNDDSQVVALAVEKAYAATPNTEVLVVAL